MPVHNETRNCKKCQQPFNVLVKRGRPHAFCQGCKPKSKETPKTV